MLSFFNNLFAQLRGIQPRSIVLRDPLKGRLTDKIGHSLPGLKISLVYIQGRRKITFAKTQSNQLGYFRIRFSQSRYNRLPDHSLYFVVFDPQGNELFNKPLLEIISESGSQFLNIQILMPVQLTGPWINNVSPLAVLPGTFIQINGNNFGEDYNDVLVKVGNRELLVLEVTPTAILARIPPVPGSLNPLVVEVSGKQITYGENLQKANFPTPQQVGTLGAPATFVGIPEQGGTN